VYRAACPLLAALFLGSCAWPEAPAAQEAGSPDVIPLPAPRLASPVSLEQTLASRRSVRRYSGDAMTLDELAQLAWAAQGITRPVPETPDGFRWEWRGGLRTAPSAGALYPLEVYAVAGKVEGLAPGVYRYVPVEHALRLEATGDRRAALAAAAHGQRHVGAAPLVFVVTAVVGRTAAKYGERAERYVHMEVGAALENALLQCEALGLGATYVGAFEDAEAHEALALPDEEQVLAIMPVGKRAPE